MKSFYIIIFTSIFFSCNSLKTDNNIDYKCISQETSENEIDNFVAETIKINYYDFFIKNIEDGIYMEIVGLKSPSMPLIIDFEKNWQELKITRRKRKMV